MKMEMMHVSENKVELDLIRDNLLRIINDINTIKKTKFCNDSNRICMMCKYRVLCLEIFQSLQTCEDVLSSTIEMLNQIMSIDEGGSHVR